MVVVGTATPRYTGGAIAPTVLHLCSEAASYINGATFVIDGGQTAH